MKKTCYYIGGTSGAGKSTLIDLVKEETNLKIVSTGSLLDSIVNDFFSLTVNRDEFKHTNWELFEPYITATLCGIISFNEAPKLVLDTHYTVYNKGYFLPAFSNGSMHYLGKTLKSGGYNQCKCILIEAPIEEIYNRIIKDKTRMRWQNITKELLYEEIKQGKEYLKRYSKILSDYIKTENILINNDILEESLNALKRHLVGDIKSYK